MIRCKSIHDNIDDLDGIRILVARFVPRILAESLGKNTLWSVHFPDLAPTPIALDLFKEKKIRFPVFVEMFLKNMCSFQSQVAIRSICSLAMTDNITLLCFEKADTFCHRRYVKQIAEEYMLKTGHDFESIWRGDVTSCIEPIIPTRIKEIEEKIVKENLNEEVCDSGREIVETV